jgi:hypothetical protein
MIFRNGRLPMQIEPCPVCGGKMRHEGMWKCEKVMCPYQVRPDPRSIAAHNALSLTAQRAEQLEHFAELAKPIVEWSRDYTRDGPVANQRNQRSRRKLPMMIPNCSGKPAKERTEIHDE